MRTYKKIAWIVRLKRWMKKKECITCTNGKCRWGVVFTKKKTYKEPKKEVQ
jgi:hypothetical protein